MAHRSKIEWTDSTWNPIRGCSMAKGSELGGCLNCYAARLNARNLPNLKSPTTGEPFARILESGPRWTGKVEIIPSTLKLPLQWKQPQRIFVNSQSDLFHEDLPFDDIDRVMAVISEAERHTFQVLTKRPEIAIRYFESRSHGFVQRSLERIWLGVSAEDQKTADVRVPILLQLPAALRFISYEPALGPVSLENSLKPCTAGCVNWVIAGGESGPGARPAHPDWFRSMRDQCAAAAVPFFFKQHGNWTATSAYTEDQITAKLSARYMSLNGIVVKNVGKASAGAVLDGREHRECPSFHNPRLLL